MDALSMGLASEFIAAGYKEFSDATRRPEPHEYASLHKRFYTEVDDKGYRAYSIEIRVYDMHRISNYPRVDTQMPRWILEAHVRFYGNGLAGADEIPSTDIHFVAKDVALTEAHAARMWHAMGRTYYE
jgi:hypothetical protein